MKPNLNNHIHIKVAAYHEAGHALAALHEGRYVFVLSVSLYEPGIGLCKRAKRPDNPFNLMVNSGTAKTSWEHILSNTCADIRISLAGPLAEAIALGKPLRNLGAYSDLTRCENMASRLNELWSYISRETSISPINTEELLDEQRRKTRRWLSQDKVWNAITLVANQLSVKGKIYNRELEYLIGQAGWKSDKQSAFNFSNN